MSVHKEDTLRNFCDVTGADENRSRFFLESSNWQLEVALSSFYEHGGHIEEASGASPPRGSVQPMSDSDMESPPRSPVQTKKKDKKKPNQNFATLDSLQQESSSEDEETQAFYAGGSERSGQQILGPGKGRKDIITEMFKSVRQQGAVVFEGEPSSSRGRSGRFGGVGHRLGHTPDDQDQETPGSGSQRQQQEQQQQEDGPRVVRLRLYRAGFVVDNGQLRLYSDPDNTHFLSCIRRGTIPPELRGHGEVKLSLEDKRHEECPRLPSKQTTMPFGGKGQMLGSPTPPTVGGTCPVAATERDREANQRAAQSDVKLDDTAPVTSVQIRLADGTRLTGRFNHSHTVRDLARFVARAEPAYQLRSFSLLAAFPRVELDEAQTLEQADLLNATVLQNLK